MFLNKMNAETYFFLILRDRYRKAGTEKVIERN